MVSEQPERFFVSEIIREQIFLQYEQEIPYSCQVRCCNASVWLADWVSVAR
jgi:GTP-binding protein Era